VSYLEACLKVTIAATVRERSGSGRQQRDGRKSRGGQLEKS